MDPKPVKLPGKIRSQFGEFQLIWTAVIEDIKTFAMPAFRSLASGEKIAQQWKAGNGWVIS